MTPGQVFVGMVYAGLLCGLAGFGALVLIPLEWDIWVKTIWIVPALGITACVLSIVGIVGFMLTGTTGELMRYFG